MIQRQAVVDVARSWLGTPYCHCQMLKGVGVDCGMLLIGVFSEAGVIKKFDPGYYAPDWHLHRGNEKFLEFVERYADRMPSEYEMQPGDVVVLKYGRRHAHGGVMLGADQFIHAMRIAGSVVVGSLNDIGLRNRSPLKYRVRGVV